MITKQTCDDREVARHALAAYRSPSCTQSLGLSESRGVDEFLLKGSPDAPLVQRIGAWLFGLFFLAAGIVFLELARECESGLLILLAIAGLGLGLKVFMNGFRRHRHQKTGS